MNLHHFPYFDLAKKSMKKNIITFSGIPYWLRSIKNLRMRTTNILVLVLGHRWNVGLMKSKIVKVKSFQNSLAYLMHTITEFFWDTLVYTVHCVHRQYTEI